MKALSKDWAITTLEYENDISLWLYCTSCNEPAISKRICPSPPDRSSYKYYYICWTCKKRVPYEHLKYWIFMRKMMNL